MSLGSKLNVDLDWNGRDWTLQIIPSDGSGNSYVTSGPIDQFRIPAILDWAKRSGYSENLNELESELSTLFDQAAQSAVSC